MAPQPHEDDVTGLLTWAAKFGLPGALVCWLVWLGGTQLVGDLRAQTRMLEQHIEASAKIQDTLDRYERRQERIEAVLRQSCVNAATDYGQRQACWAAGDR